MDRQVEHLRWLVRTRWVVSPIGAALVIVLCALMGAGLDLLAAPFGLGLLGLGFNGLTWLALRRPRSARSLMALSWAQMLLDISLTTSLVHYSGGMGSPLCLLYLLAVFSAGALLPPGGTYVAASLASLTYGGLLGGEQAGLFPLPFRLYLASSPPINPHMAWIGQAVLVSGLLYTGAFVTHHMANQTLASEQRVRRQLAEMTTLARNLELVHRTSSLIGSSLDLDQVLETTVEQMVRVFGVDHSGILILDETYHWGHVLAEYPAVGARHARFPVQGYLAAERIIADPKPLVIQDAQHDPLMAAVHETMARLGIRSMLIVPLVIRSKVIGSIGLDALAVPHSFTPREVELAQTIANQVSVAIENARLYQAERDQCALAETLRQVGATLVATLDVDTVLDRLLEQLGRVVSNDAANVMLIEGDRARVVRWRGYERFGAEAVISRLDLPVADMYTLRRMMETAEPFIVPDTHADPHWVRMPGLDWQRSYVAVPVCVRGQVIGFLNVDSATPAFFGPLHAERLRAFADQAAIALENARLYAQARAEDEQLRAVLESTGDAVVVTDPQGVIVMFNPAAERVFGVSADQVIGRPILEAAPALAESARRAAWPADGQALYVEVPLLDGRTLFWDMEPIREPGQALRGWVGVLHDVTHFKELDRVKSDLVATVSHDLRSPLHLTRGYFSALVEALGPLADDKQSLAAIVYRSLDRMEALITNLLDLEQVEAGIGLNLQDCDLGAVIADALSAVEAPAAGKQVSLHTELSPALPPVLGDARWLERVFCNLLDNAVKYSRPGDSVTVRARAEADAVIASVADTGPGIASTDLAHIFERFYRVKHQPPTPIKGTGLGLAIVQSVVRQHHGRVWVESQVGQGSTFYVALPTAPVLPRI